MNKKLKKGKIDWDKAFSEAHLTSGPGKASLCVQNYDPKPSAGSRNIFECDEEEIMRAANKYGYVIVSPPNARVVSFVNKNLMGVLK